MFGRLLQVARRLHASTWIVSACTALTLLLANVTAKIIVEPNLLNFSQDYGPNFDCEAHYEHGWPTSFVHRNLLSGMKPVSRWKIQESVTRFSYGWLLADLTVAAALLAMTILGFEAWRRRRRSVIQ